MAGGGGASKAQAALARIIAVILTAPPCHASTIDVDLSLRLGGAGRSAVVDPPAAADQGFLEAEAGGEKSSEGECEKAIPEITNLDAQREEEKGRGEGYLELLLEAARQVGGGGFSDDEGESGKGRRPGASAAEGRGGGAGRSRRKRATSSEWTAPLGLYELEEEETAPVVRSKRGRSQALPSRYRDSVLEPWRKPPTVYRNGGRTTMAGR